MNRALQILLPSSTRWLGMMALLLCVQGCTIPVFQWKPALERTVARADRMIIHNSPNRQESDRKPVEIADRKLMADFVNAVEIDERETVPNQYCACLGEVQIIFQRGHKELAWVSIGHTNSLKWNHGHWNGDAILTKKSRTAIADWLKSNARIVPSPKTTAERP